MKRVLPSPTGLRGAAALLTAGLVTLLAPPGRAAEPLTVGSTSQAVDWTVSWRGQPVLVCAADPSKFKPYVKALYTLKGYNVLRDAPGDHLHHHALMYGIRVNGLNFWEETAGNGVQRVVESAAPELAADAAGRPQARLAQTIYWLAPADAFLPVTNAPALLVEHRTLTLTVDETAGEVALHWQARFAVGTKTNTVVLSGANYHGLGMRFLKELDPLASHFTSAGNPNLEGSKQDVSPHPWEAVAFDAPGRPATIALFGGPANARGDARLFAMKTPFAYLSATQGLDQEPLVYHAGDQFELDYLVTLYAEVKSPAALAERAQKWRTSGQ